MKTVVNISADKIAFFRGGKVDFLERNGVDVEIGKMLVGKHRETPITECLVINWPWGFTNLRVGTLALNLLKTLTGDQLSFFSLSKLELYALAYQKGFLPRWGVIYIGQKMNVWLRDFEEKKLTEVVKKATLEDLQGKVWAFFCDEVYEEGYFDGQNQLSCFFDEAGACLKYQGEALQLDWEELLKHPLEKLEPNYMIEPNVN